ncbi:periplasmic chaperone for outer membrane proteins Skp [Hasllibacter halocynthiae]|uniref:Periplasmic chaperone for outer membrane proteins Skp n=1 Tax=Hasllibacter halocynthiae TaxID=595589 RepID=A0A2T0X869_9RHOB|nr:OmpH family outer membrane protein [Hasllibacter halocynthiae]PRY95095.1 periplasmic chaperone for outer membrane proteins Skp [Hasllibacter halocynthiae]
MGLTLRPVLLAAALAVAVPATAQDVAEGVLVLDRERVLAESRLGSALLAEIDEEGRDLAAENTSIQEELRAEEAALTERRDAMDPDAFRAAATAFDERVQSLRAAQDAKTRAHLARRDAVPDLFWDQALPILAGILEERGAGLLLDRGDVFLSSDDLDITDEAVARIDAATIERAREEDGEGAQPAAE